MLVEKSQSPNNKKPLLEKYDIPLSHLDFEYVKTCSNVQELEKIVKILRSNEEGYYPELLKEAEKQLEKYLPNSRLLRVTLPVANRNSIKASEWKALQEELTKWKSDLEESEACTSQDLTDSEKSLPEIRTSSAILETVSKKETEKKSEDRKKKMAASFTDYRKWDMYDADSECLKLDLEEERKNEKNNKQEDSKETAGKEATKEEMKYEKKPKRSESNNIEKETNEEKSSVENDRTITNEVKLKQRRNKPSGETVQSVEGDKTIANGPVQFEKSMTSVPSTENVTKETANVLRNKQTDSGENITEKETSEEKPSPIDVEKLITNPLTTVNGAEERTNEENTKMKEYNNIAEEDTNKKMPAIVEALSKEDPITNASTTVNGAEEKIDEEHSKMKDCNNIAEEDTNKKIPTIVEALSKVELTSNVPSTVTGAEERTDEVKNIQTNDEKESSEEKLSRVESEEESVCTSTAVEAGDAPLSLKEQQLIPECLSEEERKLKSLKEKDIGNVFYKKHRYNEALKHYTRSISIYPHPVSYNNRAAAYLKQCRFSLALSDLNIVLEKEPENVKARFRRAMAWQHKNEFKKALEDINVVLEREPKNILARHHADQIKISLPRPIRIRVSDDNDPSKVIIKEVTEEELKRDYKDRDYIEVNEWGLPKIMCNCRGEYFSDPNLSEHDPIRYQHMWPMRQRFGKELQLRMAQVEKRYNQLSQPTGNSLKTETSTGKSKLAPIELLDRQPPSHLNIPGAKRLDILELERIEEDEETYETEATPRRACLVADMRPQSNSYFSRLKEVSKGPYVQRADSPSTVKHKEDIGSNELTKTPVVEVYPSLSGKGQALLEEEFELFPTMVDPDDEPTDQVTSEAVKVTTNDIDNISRLLFPGEGLAKCDCGEGYVLKATQFESKWMQLQNSAKPLDGRGQLIRLVCPHRLSSVIGNKIDESLLCGLVSSLGHHFDTVSERDKILSYLVHVSKLPRFKIINGFLSTHQRQVVSSLLERLEPVPNDLRDALGCF